MKKLFFLVALLFVFTNCEDFLNTRNYTSKDGSSFPKTEDDAAQLVVGCYNNLSLCCEVLNSYFYYAEIFSDDRFGGGGYNDKPPQATNHLLYSDLNMTNSFWTRRYTGIARINVTLEALESLEQTENIIQKIGEVRIMRAFLYFELVQLLGDVPLVTSIPDNVQQAKESPPQNSQEEIFRFIAKELWEAYNDMSPVQWNTLQSGTINKWVAAGLLARVYLFYTGFYNKESLPMEGGGEVTRGQVQAALENIMNNSGHSLVPDYHSLWPYTNSITKKDYPFAIDLPVWVRDGENPEHVFVKKMAPTNYGQPYQANEYSLHFGVRRGAGSDFENIFPLGEGWGFGPVNTRLWEDWLVEEPDDPRRKASIWHYDEEMIYDDVFSSDRVEIKAQYLWGADRQSEETGLWQKKVVATTAYGKGNTGRDLWSSFTSEMYNNPQDNFQRGHATDLIYMRYADILLMHSEITRTVEGINAVRARVNLPPVAAYNDEALKKERRFELAFEGLRWGDIRRWHIAEEVLPRMYGVDCFVDSYFTIQKPQSSGGVAERYKATNGFYMIPQTQIDLSDGKLKQNPGWGPEASFVQWTN